MPILRRPYSTVETVSEVAPPPQNAAPSTAIERLEASRARLRAVMSPSRRRVAERGDLSSPGWLMRVENLPGVRAIVNALKSWWTRHPLRPVVTLAHQTTDAFVTPVAQSHPIAMVSAGLLLGALMVTVRPWRWGLKRVLFAGLVPQLVSNLPIDSWLGKLRVVEDRQARTRTEPHTEIQRGEVRSREVP